MVACLMLFLKIFTKDNPKTFIIGNIPLFSTLTDKKQPQRNFGNLINLQYHNSKRIKKLLKEFNKTKTGINIAGLQRQRLRYKVAGVRKMADVFQTRRDAILNG